MKFNFEKFTDTDASFAATVTVRQRTGQLGFNAGAVNRFKIRQFRYVVLYFDNSNRAVGLELSREKTVGAIEIKQRESNTYVPAKNFLDKWGIDYAESHRHKLHTEDISGMLYFLLDDREDNSENDDTDEQDDGERHPLDDLFT